MNTFNVLFLCVQACLVQNVFGQCAGRYNAAFAPTAAIAPCGAAPFAYGGLGAPYGLNAPFAYDGLAAPYGGTGEGNVAVAGELPVAGTTAVAGQVPIMGAVKFCGDVAAGGAVSIAGNCACGCGSGAPYGAAGPCGAGYLY